MRVVPQGQRKPEQVGWEKRSGSHRKEQSPLSFERGPGVRVVIVRGPFKWGDFGEKFGVAGLKTQPAQKNGRNTFMWTALPATFANKPRTVYY